VAAVAVVVDQQKAQQVEVHRLAVEQEPLQEQITTTAQPTQAAVVVEQVRANRALRAVQVL
jgi:hypothetical protein